MFQTQTSLQNIAAIIPCYLATGDSTCIIQQDGHSTTLPARIRTVIQNLARSKAIDLIALKASTRQTTARKNMAPLPLAPGLVLIPLKIRKPRVTGDITTGYVNSYAISSIRAAPSGPYQTTIILSGSTELPVIWSPATVKRQLALARLAASPLAAGQIPYTGTVRESFPGYAPELLTLAVKLVDVFNEILCMKQRQS